MYEFDYAKANAVDEALDKLKAADDGKILAGGMTLIPTLKQRLAMPSDLIDLGGIDDMAGISVDGSVVTIGAMTRHAVVAASEDVQKTIPALAVLAGGIGDPAVRHRGTIGGSVANADPAADYPAGVLGLNATVITNEREIAADDFFVDLFETALSEEEIIKAVRFPI
ncbi:MAG: FAD binding domain-containing protein, partial [Rhodospirillales bacterium]